MNIILLGYDGLIGSHVLKNLFKLTKENKKIHITCVNRTIKNQPFKDKRIKYEKWDFNKFDKKNIIFLKKKKNIIINCVGKNNCDYKNLTRINVLFVKNLLKFIKINKKYVRFIQLGSVSVYGAEEKYLGRIKNINEKSYINANNPYSKSKLEAEILIKKFSKKHQKYFNFTILRISNVYSDLKYSNSSRIIKFFLKWGFWFRTTKNTIYHYIHADDVALAILNCITYLNKSANKIYIVSNEISQSNLHKLYEKKNFSRLILIRIPLYFINFVIKNIKIPKKLYNFFLTISSQITYNNLKIKKELKYYPKQNLIDYF